MNFRLLFTTKADQQLSLLEENPALKKQVKAVRKTLGFMEVNLRHPSLNTHKFSSLEGVGGEAVFESYAENHTPGAYRIFWCYGPEKNQITVLAIVPHP